MSKIVLRQCIRKIVAPPQAVPGAIKILAIDGSSDKIFLSNVSSGNNLIIVIVFIRSNFIRVRDWSTIADSF
jgi:hypothetical protein